MTMETYFEFVKVGMGDFSLPHLAWYLFIVAICILATAVFSICDAFSGIYTAWKTNEPIRSHLLRKTIEKMCVYWFFQFLVAILGFIISLILPTHYDLPYLSMVLAVAICGVELWSIYENHKRIKNGHLQRVSTSMETFVGELIEMAGGEEALKKALRERLGTEEVADKETTK